MKQWINVSVSDSDLSKMASDSQSDSQYTASSSLTEDSLNLSFEDITYEVRNGIFSRGHKTVLAGLSGAFNAGELTIIMGQSGAGKSSLMDILAGYTNPTSGRVYVNGRRRNLKTFRKRSCYILQDDKIQEYLTTHESLVVAADLKLGNHISKEQKVKRIEEIITSLELSKARDTRAGHLSGGQKKRLAIGLELVSDPPVMFLDEPTSGLDSSISKSMMRVLSFLAKQGRTVVATMHQPSAALLQLVDRLYAIVNGQCAYIGSVPMLLPYLEQIDLTCPPYHNPVDFLIEICVDNASDLVLQSQNGKETEWIANISKETDNEIEKIDCLELQFIVPEEISLTVLPPPKENPTNKILMKLKSTHSTSFWKQFCILTKRSIMSNWRDPHFTLMFTGIHFAMALVVGTLFYNVGEDAKYVRDSYNCLYFSLMFLMFTAFSAVTVTFPQQFPVIRREHFNRWYMAGAYYWSTLISALPTQTICTLTYAWIVYWLTGQPKDFVRFICFCWTLMLVSHVALCIGLLNGSIFNVKGGVIFGPFFIMPFVIFSGFFLLYKDAPFFSKWLFHISFLKHGLVALTIGIYGMDRPKMHCPPTEVMCYYTYPKQILIENDMIHEELWLAYVCLMVISVVVNFGTYLMLKIRLRGKW